MSRNPSPIPRETATMQKRIVTEDRIVTVVTTVTEEDRVVDYADIYDSVCVEIDDWHNESPWDSCDGWEHEIRSVNLSDHDDIQHSRGHVRPNGYDSSRVVSIDDADIVEKWGVDGYPGASKQVRAELIASAKRTALDQLVKWYCDGWEWYQVCGEYMGYTDSLCGIDDFDYADGEVRDEITAQIADQMENDDFVVTGRPVMPAPLTRAGRYRQNRKYRDESYIVKTA